MVALLEIVYRILRAAVARSEEHRPLDTTIIELARVVACMEQLAPAWKRPDVYRYLLEQLVAVARTIESDPGPNRIPLAQWTLRARAQKPIAQIADLVRAHALAVADVRTRAAYDRILASLTAGLVAACREDWDALLENAAPVTAERWYRRYAVRNLTPAILLAAAAIALPWLPPFRSNPTSILGLRVTLGVYAALRLLPGSSLLDLVDRGLARGFTGGSKAK